jgi:sterol desaturase/sphingolipid hydroxylase (fatty acid hydroxylase superfamily)
MIDVWDSVLNACNSFANWVISEITFNTPVWYINYFLWLILISAIVFGLEVLIPWRKTQSIIRRDFWKDFQYMFLNFYVFAFFLTGFYALFGELISFLGIRIENLVVFDLMKLPLWLGLLIFFIVNDFVQWFTHFLLHKVHFFWLFHKVHHSVK